MTTSGIALLTRPASQSMRRRVVRLDWVLLWSGILGAFSSLLLFLVAYRGIVDDGYIVLAFTKNLAFHGEWAVTPGLESNTATSPLFVLLLAAVTLVTRGPVISLGVVLVATVTATAVLTSLTARRCGWPWWAGPIVAVLLATSPLMASTLGLESFLLIALLVGLLYAVVCGRSVWVGVLCGLIVLTRPDAGVFVVLAMVALVVTVRSIPGVRLLRTVLMPPTIAALVVAPWAVTSILMFGTPIPDTLVWKTSQTQGLGGRYYGDALPLFLSHWRVATILSVALVILGAVALLGWLVHAPTHPVTILIGAGGIAHSILMSILTVPPFTWYYAPTTACAALLVAFSLVAIARLGPQLVATIPVFLLVAGCLAYIVRHDYTNNSSPFHANYATAEQYAQLASRVPTGSVLQTSHGEVGTLAYFCACTVVDPLSDPGRLSHLINDAKQARGIKGHILRVLYTAWQPSTPIPAQWQTIVSDRGTRIWSGFGGWSYLDIVPTNSSEAATP